MATSNLTISSTVKKYPNLPFQSYKDEILGKKYNLSLAFIGAKKAKALNIATRKKTYVPNVLSFPLDTNEGEMYICPEAAKTEAKSFNLSVDGHIAFLFVHGLLHLKGMDHGDKMDQKERFYVKKFKLI